MNYAKPIQTDTMQRRQVVLAEEALEVACPKCYAQVGEPCQGRRGPRKNCHIERHHLRIEANEGLPDEDKLGAAIDHVFTILDMLPECDARRYARVKLKSVYDIASKIEAKS
ncbi:zinc finger domain-containing protein [Sulfitobacter sp.]|uniref:zinc finger domain-containing protein n=1 Tax=Sulfitobacter sp. TaxID=1903071 RepID=UPI003EFAE33A